MSTANKKTPSAQEYDRFEKTLGDGLTFIYGRQAKLAEEKQGWARDSDLRDLETAAQGAANKLLHDLYVIMRTVQLHYDDELAWKLQEIVDILATKDLADEGVRAEVLAKRGSLKQFMESKGQGALL